MWLRCHHTLRQCWRKLSWKTCQALTITWSVLTPQCHAGQSLVLTRATLQLGLIGVQTKLAAEKVRSRCTNKAMVTRTAAILCCRNTQKRQGHHCGPRIGHHRSTRESASRKGTHRKVHMFLTWRRVIPAPRSTEAQRHLLVRSGRSASAWSWYVPERAFPSGSPLQNVATQSHLCTAHGTDSPRACPQLGVILGVGIMILLWRLGVLDLSTA